MTVALRPMNLGEILDRSFQVYRARFFVFAGIAALPAAAMFGIRLAEENWLHGAWTIHMSRQTVTLWNLFASLVSYHVASFLSLLVFPAQVHVASATSQGDESSISTALHLLVARWRVYLRVAALKLFALLVIPEILFFTLALGIALVSVLAGSLGAGSGMGAAAVLLIIGLPVIAAFTLFLWLGGCFSLVVPACAIEGIGGFPAFRRSWVLSKGSRGRIILSWLMIFIFALLLSYGLSYGFRWFFPFLCRAPFLGPMARGFFLPAVYLLYAAASTLTGSLYPIAATLFYYDQRIRLEGYDIERMMEEAGMTAPATQPGGDGPIASGVEGVRL